MNQNATKQMWATLIHLSTNFWFEEGNTRTPGGKIWQIPASPVLRFDRKVFSDHLDELEHAGCNTIVLDLGDGMVYRSHPEIAVKGALSYEEMQSLIDEIHGHGMEIIPKLNFSTTHDEWMHEYARMVSSETYYKVCKDLIDEVCALFKPRFLHLGMDEEGYECQKNYDHVVIRAGELWWKDFFYLVGCVEKNGVRAMMWADLAREHADEVIKRIPKSVVMCPWYYFNQFGSGLDEYHLIRVRPFGQLAEAGYDFLCCGSVEYEVDNLERLTEYVTENVPAEHRLGFCQTTWTAVTDEWRKCLSDSAVSIGNSKKICEKKNG